ncbi:uncharacterized protein LOC131657572 [Vicia villosa]|uniref:uncharacterized protein LOC131657572 n=1 Tax=Vicia villosa TaxID=3911 RepID=UPI00273C8C73|nr:uncharacterized protein LOC131657572 [Vicia villosa]
MARAKLVGNLTKKKGDDSMLCFTFLKILGININPRATLSMIDVLWCPLYFSWIKCNVYDMAKGPLAACGGIFRDSQANHILSFSVFLGEGSPVVAEFMTTVIAIEKAKQMNWKKVWVETNCKLVVLAFTNCNLVPWKVKSRWQNIGFNSKMIT